MIICYSHPTPENIPKAKVAHKTMLLTKISVKIRNKTEAYYIALNKQGVRDRLFQIFPFMGRCTSFYPQYNQDLTEVRASFFSFKRIKTIVKRDVGKNQQEAYTSESF